VASEMAAMALGTVQVNKFSWNKKLTKYVKDGQPEEVMQLFQQMQQEGMNPDKFTFVQEINASAGLGALEDGRLVNEQLIQSGFRVSDAHFLPCLFTCFGSCMRFFTLLMIYLCPSPL